MWQYHDLLRLVLEHGPSGQRRLARTQDASVAAALMQQSYLDRRFDFAAKIDAAIAAQSAADVSAALRKYVSPDGFAYAYGGDFARSR